MPGARYPLAELIRAACRRLMRPVRDLRAGRLRLHRLRRDLAAVRRDTLFDRLMSESVSDGLLIQELDGAVAWANPAFCKMTGHTLEAILGRKPQTFVFPPDLRPSDEEIAAFRYDPALDHLSRRLRRNIRADGTEFWNEHSISFREDPGGRMLAILCCRDVSEQVAREQDLRDTSAKLAYAAAHDSLTGLANRAELMAFTARAMAGPGPGRVGMLHVDLDHFKAVNDTHGHSAGDAILVHIAGALRTVLRPGDLAARLGGDEFVICCPDIPSLDVLREIGDRLSAAINQPVLWHDRQISCSASIGADLAPEGDTSVEGLFQRSDFALYEAKKAGRDQLAAYDEVVHQRHAAQQELGADLTAAVHGGALSFAFQPILDLDTGQIVTLETLVRWQHPRLGPMSPGQFLPLAEELGLMSDLDFLAMGAAIDLKARLNRQGKRGLSVAINASSALLAHPDFTSRLAQGLRAQGVTPPEIGIEVLETVVFDAPGSGDKASAMISALRTAGHPVMLDDFGVGYAGLAHLAHLEVSGIKIDLSLVQAAKSDPTSVRILETMIELCSRLGLISVAEGVDTVWMATRLQDMGASRLQGWWLAPALPADEIETWLQGHSVPETPAAAPLAPAKAHRYLA